MALAMATRCRSPPDNSSGMRCNKLPMPKSSMDACKALFASVCTLFEDFNARLKPKFKFSATLRWGNKLDS